MLLEGESGRANRVGASIESIARITARESGVSRFFFTQTWPSIRCCRWRDRAARSSPMSVAVVDGRCGRDRCSASAALVRRQVRPSSARPVRSSIASSISRRAPRRASSLARPSATQSAARSASSRLRTGGADAHMAAREQRFKGSAGARPADSAAQRFGVVLVGVAQEQAAQRVVVGRSGTRCRSSSPSKRRIRPGWVMKRGQEHRFGRICSSTGVSPALRQRRGARGGRRAAAARPCGGTVPGTKGALAGRRGAEQLPAAGA